MNRREFFLATCGAAAVVVTGKEALGKEVRGGSDRHRKVQVLYRDMEGVGFWVDTKMKEIRKGNVFMMFEPDGEQVVDSKGQKLWVATGDAFFSYNDDARGEVWGVNAELPGFPIIMNPGKGVRMSDIRPAKAITQSELEEITKGVFTWKTKE
jgi:hypothetical protein